MAVSYSERSGNWGSISVGAKEINFYVVGTGGLAADVCPISTWRYIILAGLRIRPLNRGAVSDFRNY